MAAYTCQNCGESNLPEIHNEYFICLGCGFQNPLPTSPNNPNDGMSDEVHTTPEPTPQLQVNEGSPAPENVDSPADGPLPGTPVFPPTNIPGDLTPVDPAPTDAVQEDPTTNPPAPIVDAPPVSSDPSPDAPAPEAPADPPPAPDQAPIDPSPEAQPTPEAQP